MRYKGFLSQHPYDSRRIFTWNTKINFRRNYTPILTLTNTTKMWFTSKTIKQCKSSNGQDPLQTNVLSSLLLNTIIFNQSTRLVNSSVRTVQLISASSSITSLSRRTYPTASVYMSAFESSMRSPQPTPDLITST